MLLTRGRSTIQQLVQRSELPLKTVREALFCLIQHNLVTFAENEEGTRVITYYQISPLEIMFRDRFTLYLLLAKNRLDSQMPLKLLQLILSHGRCSPNALMALTESTQDAVHQGLSTLLENHFISQVTLDDSLTEIDLHIKEERDAVQASTTPLTTSEVVKLRKSLKERRDSTSVPCINVEKKSERV